MSRGISEKEQRWLLVLSQVIEVLDKNNLLYFIDTGTLLGAVRDKRFIPWDNDIDLAVIGGDTSTTNLLKVSKLLYALGFYVTLTKKEIAICSRDGVNLGIKLYKKQASHYEACMGKVYRHRLFYSINLYLSGEVLYKKGFSFKYKAISLFVKFSQVLKLKLSCIWQMKLLFWAKYDEKTVIIPFEFVDAIIDYNFYNIIVKVPNKPERYLAYRYGENWKVPKQDYDYMIDDKSIINID
ncbi:LicD family protein [Bacteroides uniformis]|uniref:LicD family protein n=1 Tax=Bacteroides uniformis TaxID=820 RepID=UPI0039B6DCFB